MKRMKQLEHASHKLLHFLTSFLGSGISEQASDEEIKQYLQQKINQNPTKEDELRRNSFSYFRIRYDVTKKDKTIIHEDGRTSFQHDMILRAADGHYQDVWFRYTFDGETYHASSNFHLYIPFEDAKILTHLLKHPYETCNVDQHQLRRAHDFFNQPMKYSYGTHEYWYGIWRMHLLINGEPITYLLNKQGKCGGIEIRSIHDTLTIRHSALEKALFTYLTETSPFRMIWLYQ